MLHTQADVTAWVSGYWAYRSATAPLTTSRQLTGGEHADAATPDALRIAAPEERH
jgi:hypothetical protein